MEIYVIFILLIFLFLGNYKIGRNKKPFILSIFGILLIISLLALRFDIGADYSQYYSNFLNDLNKDRIPKYEPVNLIIFLLLSPFNSPQLIIAFYGLITIILICVGINNNTKNFFLGIITYVCLFYIQSFSILRQSLALAIVLCSYKSLVNKKFFKFYIICSIAVLAHYSALISFLFPIIYLTKPRFLFFIISISFIFSYIGMNYIEKIPFLSKYAIYFTIINEGGGNIKKYFFWLIIIFLWIYIFVTKKDYPQILILITTGACLPLILGGHVGGRIAMYFYIFLCIAVPNIFYKTKQTIKIGYIVFITFFFLSFIYNATDSGGDSKAFVPYQTFFNQNLENPIFK